VQLTESLTARLPELQLANGRLEWDPGLGVSILQPNLRITLGSSDQIDAKLVALAAIRQRLTEARLQASIIDVRSLDRPYFR
jgi:hypothetical protein